jgi:hypothetical protein
MVRSITGNKETLLVIIWLRLKFLIGLNLITSIIAVNLMTPIIPVTLRRLTTLITPIIPVTLRSLITLITPIIPATQIILIILITPMIPVTLISLLTSIQGSPVGWGSVPLVVNENVSVFHAFSP